MNKTKLTILTALLTLSSSTVMAGNIEDTATTAAVKAALIAEQDIPANDIEVTTKDGVVSLKGLLDTYLQTDRVVQIVSGISNVEDVTADDLKVKDSSSLIMDTVISAKAKGKISSLYINKKVSEGYDLHVETTNKIVHVFGEVEKAEDINTVIDALRKLSNVTEVKANIKVKS